MCYCLISTQNKNIKTHTAFFCPLLLGWESNLRPCTWLATSKPYSQPHWLPQSSSVYHSVVSPILTFIQCSHCSAFDSPLRTVLALFSVSPASAVHSDYCVLRGLFFWSSLICCSLYVSLSLGKFSAIILWNMFSGLLTWIFSLFCFYYF